MVTELMARLVLHKLVARLRACQAGYPRRECCGPRSCRSPARLHLLVPSLSFALAFFSRQFLCCGSPSVVPDRARVRAVPRALHVIPRSIAPARLVHSPRSRDRRWRRTSVPCGSLARVSPRAWASRTLWRLRLHLRRALGPTLPITHFESSFPLSLLPFALLFV